MARRLILDTGVLIDVERNRRAIRSLTDDDDIVIAAVTVAELRTGVELARKRNRSDREAFVASVLEELPVLVYDTEVADAHGQLLAHVHRSGTPRGAHDLIIAATAAVTGRLLVTTDRQARFAELPGVICLD